MWGDIKKVACSQIKNNEILQKIVQPYQEYLSSNEYNANWMITGIPIDRERFVRCMKVNKKYINDLSPYAMGLNVANVSLKLQNLNSSNDNNIWNEIKAVDKKLIKIFNFIKGLKKENNQKFKIDEKVIKSLCSLHKIFDRIDAISNSMKEQDKALIDQEVKQEDLKIFYNRLNNIEQLLQSDNFVMMMRHGVHYSAFDITISRLLRCCVKNFVTAIGEIKKYNNITEESSQIAVIKQSRYINKLFCNIFYQRYRCLFDYGLFADAVCDADLRIIEKLIIVICNKDQLFNDSRLAKIMQPYQDLSSLNKFSLEFNRITNVDYFNNYLTYQVFCEHDTLKIFKSINKKERIRYYLTHFAIELDFALAYIKQRWRDNYDVTIQASIRIQLGINIASSVLRQIFKKLWFIDCSLDEETLFNNIAVYCKHVLINIKNSQRFFKPEMVSSYRYVYGDIASPSKDRLKMMRPEEDFLLRLTLLKNLFNSKEFLNMQEFCKNNPHEKHFTDKFSTLVNMCALDFVFLVREADRVLFGKFIDEFCSNTNNCCINRLNQKRNTIITNIKRVNSGLSNALEILKNTKNVQKMKIFSYISRQAAKYHYSYLRIRNNKEEKKKTRQLKFFDYKIDEIPVIPVGLTVVAFFYYVLRHPIKFIVPMINGMFLWFANKKLLMW